jgi:hypothetical protein
MLERVTIETRAVTGDDGARVVRAALADALEFRDARVEDDHDPRLLHTARTIRIMIADGDCRSVDMLAAAAFVDTIDEELVRPPASALNALVAAVPRPQTAGDELLERLVTASPETCLIAVVERLDHARHLHLRDAPPWRDFHDEIRAVYIPAARRCSASVARRLERWADAFERRLILPR